MYGFNERASVHAVEAVVSRTRHKPAARATALVKNARGIGCRLVGRG